MLAPWPPRGPPSLARRPQVRAIKTHEQFPPSKPMSRPPTRQTGQDSVKSRYHSGVQPIPQQHYPN
eukprot:8813513-Pyramimonas_sp.AAC.1